MQANRWGSLWRDRRTLWLLLIAVAILLAAALWAFLDHQRIVAEMAVEADQRMARLAAARIHDELAQFPDALVALAGDADIASQDPTRQAAALAEAPPLREGLFDAGLLLLDNFGAVVAAAPPRPELMQQDWSDKAYFRALLAGAPTSAVFSDAVGEGPAGSQVIVVSVPVIDGEGRFVGALAGLLRLGQSAVSPYYATLVKLRVSPDGMAYLIDGDHKILFDSASLRNGEQYNDYVLPPADQPGAAAALRTHNAAGREVLVSQAPVPGTPWTLVMEKEWTTVIAPTAASANLLLALLGLGAVLPLGALALLARQNGRETAQRSAIGRESHIAHRVEQALLADPPPLLPGWEIAVHREPAPAIGRVFHDILPGADGCLTLILAETSRPGPDAGYAADGVSEVLSMVAVRTLLRSAARDLLSPVPALQRTNQLLCPDLPPATLISCLYCRLDPVSGAVAMGNADQVRPIRLVASLGDSPDASVDTNPAAGTQWAGGKGPPLGLQFDGVYQEYGALLATGDSLCLCSSEVLAVCNPDGQPFGRARLEQVLASPTPGVPGPKGRIAAVTEALRQFAGGKWANDRDAILIVLERLPSSPTGTKT